MISRFFNELTISDNKIIKKFIGSKDLEYTIKDEISYYKNIEDSIFPKVFEYFDNGYVMEYLKSYKPLQYIPKNRHKIIFDKIKEKYSQWEQTRIKSDDFFNFLWNKIPYDEKIHTTLKRNKSILCNLQIIHGDLTTMNILINENNDIKFVDPRGPSIFGCVYYDLAKMYESYILGFGDIVSNYKHEYDLKIFEDFISKYDKHLILTIVYINLVSKLKLHNEEEQKRFIELAKRVYEWL